jgi:hypothetical protein
MLNNLKNISLWEFEGHILLLILLKRFLQEVFIELAVWWDFRGSWCPILYP